MEKKFLMEMREFGLNTYESKIWAALLSRGVSTAGELSDIANVPRSRSYDVLESLEKKGFVIMKLGKPIKYTAVPPKEVLEKVKKNVEEKTKKQLITIDFLKTGKIIKELGLLYKQGKRSQVPKEVSGSLRGRKNLYNHLETMLKNAKKSVVIMTSYSRFDKKTKLFKNVLDNLVRKGVKVKVALKSDKNFKKTLYINEAIEIRKTDIDARFCVVDNSEFLFMLFDAEEIHPSYDVGIWVVNQNLSKNIADVFESVWKNTNSGNQ